MIWLVCYFLLFSIVFAFNVSIYTGTDYYRTTSPVPELIVENKYEFVYNLNETLMMNILLKNKAPDVIATLHVTNQTYAATVLLNMTKCKEGDCLSIRHKLNSQFIVIGMQLNKGNVTCLTSIISEGNNATLSNTTSKANLCVQRNCVMVIDLQDKCSKDIPVQQPQPQSTSTTLDTQNKGYIYAISSVIVMCVIILAIYLSAKKFLNRNSDPEETMELNTYATKNEVLYADLSFVQGNNQPPRHEEESPYAEIATKNEVLYADLSFVQGNNQPPRHEEESPYAEIVGVLHSNK